MSSPITSKKNRRRHRRRQNKKSNEENQPQYQNIVDLSEEIDAIISKVKDNEEKMLLEEIRLDESGDENQVGEKKKPTPKELLRRDAFPKLAKKLGQLWCAIFNIKLMLEPIVLLAEEHKEFVHSNPWSDSESQQATIYWLEQLNSLKNYMDESETKLLLSHLNPLFFNTPKAFQDHYGDDIKGCLFDHFKKELQDSDDGYESL